MAALKTASRRVLMASFLVLGLVVTAAAFAIGFAFSLQQGLNDPQSAPRLRQEALARLDDSLGYSGYLKAYRIFAGGDRAAGAELRRLSLEADRNLAQLLLASTNDQERETAASLRRLAAPFRRIALFAGASNTSFGALPAESELERDYALLKAQMDQAAEAAAFDRVRSLSDALVWAQVTSVAALSLLSTVLFALAWYLRMRLINPLAKLRRSVAGAANGALGEPIWGIERKDEFGAVARAADKLRQTIDEAAKATPPPPLAKMMERLANSAVRLEADLAKMTAVTSHARTRIEEATKQAAKASHAAIQVTDLAREGAARITGHTNDSIKNTNSEMRSVVDALGGTLMRLSETAAHITGHANTSIQSTNSEMRSVVEALAGTLTRLSEAAAKFDAARVGESNGRETNGRLALDAGALAGVAPFAPEGDDVAYVLEGLSSDLTALEDFAKHRRTLAQDEGVAMTAALLEAIDRLNHVADRISDATIRTNRKIA